MKKKTVLEVAVQHNRRKPFFEILFRLGVDPNTKTADGEYLFHQVAKEKKNEVLEAFLEAGIDKNARNLEGKPLIHILGERVKRTFGIF